VRAIFRAIGDNDPEALELNAHALKGSCTVIGALGMKDIAYKLEKIGQSSHLDEAPGVLNRLEDEFALVKEELEKKKTGKNKFSTSSTRIYSLISPIHLPSCPDLAHCFLSTRHYRLARF
jgi:HPt (histidine-containing phosphotransfer) domain-containing protein